MTKNFTRFIIDKKLPYLELRHSNSSKHYKEHIHDTFSIGVNIKGRSLYTNKHNRYHFEENMLAIINPNYIHSCNSLEKEDNEYYMLYLDKKWCLNLQKNLDINLTEFKEISFDILKNKEFYKEFINLCKIIDSKEFYLYKECKLIEFFESLFTLDINNKNSTIIEINKIKDICLYLEKNYQNNVTLDELAKEFGLNSFYIIRLFKHELNISPHQFLLNLKINKSKELLKAGNSIVNTALDCGFTDQSHFHRNFVNMVATTPRKFQINFIQ